MVGADDRRYDGTAEGAAAIADGEQVTLEFTFPDAVTPQTIGLAVLVVRRGQRGRDGAGAQAHRLTVGARRPARPTLGDPDHGRTRVHRALRSATLIGCAALLAASSVTAMGSAPAAAAPAGASITVKARLTGWVARRDGYFLYRDGATVRMVVGVWPALPREDVLARLEWRRTGNRWRVLDVSTATFNRDGRASFLVRGLPDGYSFRIRAKVPSTGRARGGSLEMALLPGSLTRCGVSRSVSGSRARSRRLPTWRARTAGRSGG